MPTLTQGAAAAEQISEEIKAKANKRYRIRQAILKNGEGPWVFRFVTDFQQWISVDIHGFVPTKAKPDAYTGQNWPKSMWAVCMRDRMFRLRGTDGGLLDEFEEGYGTCYIHDTFGGQKEGPFNKDRGLPDAQVLALAVEREPETDPATGNVIGFKDKLADWTDPQGNVVKIPAFVVVSQKYSNFWAPIKAACYVAPQTVTNKDFMVSREEKSYTIAPVSQTPDFMAGTPAWKAQYEDVLAAMEFTLPGYVLDHASQDHYDRWFIPGRTPKDGYARKDAETEGEDAGQAKPAAAASAAPAIDQDAMAAYKASLQSRGGK